MSKGIFSHAAANVRSSAITDVDPIYTGLVTTVQVLYLLEICHIVA